MYKACIIEDNPLIRTVLTSVLKQHNFEVSEFCNVRERCSGFQTTCGSDCKQTGPCHNMLILFNCERDTSGVQFLKFIEQNHCPCSHSFKVLYTCKEVNVPETTTLKNLHVQLVEKDNPAFDMLPMIEKYKEWLREQEVHVGEL